MNMSRCLKYVTVNRCAAAFLSLRYPSIAAVLLTDIVVLITFSYGTERAGCVDSRLLLHHVTFNGIVFSKQPGIRAVSLLLLLLLLLFWFCENNR